MEMLMVLVLVVVLMASFIFYYFKQQTGLRDVGFTALSHSFSAKLTSVHAQWLMEGKPKALILRTALTPKPGKNTQQRISLNVHGWIDVPSGQQGSLSRCQAIWHQVLELPMVFLKSPVAALELRNSINGEYIVQSAIGDNKQAQGGIDIVCRYSLLSGEYFQYHSRSGKVQASKSH